ncbi:MAG: hypothetical protein Q8L55_03375 [Phycisphaerales bacterium]|nr:hypothetical protein [Phycisphaerales bacterium]
MDHTYQDRVSLAMNTLIAAQLPSRPEWLKLARDNLARWKRLNADAPSLLRCYHEWEAILQCPLTDVCSLLTAQTENSQRLRTNSPFAGALTPQQVWEIKRRFRNDQNAA